MNQSEYKQRALRLESNVNRLRRTWHSAIPALTATIFGGEFADVAKRVSFYSVIPNPIDSIGRIAAAKELFLHGTPEQLDLPNNIDHLDPRAVHAILGIISESAELAKELFFAIAERRPLNLENVFEERGDLNWYENLLDDALGFDPDAIRAGNIAKLERRHRDGANPQQAGHDPSRRNRKAEMEAMNAAAFGTGVLFKGTAGHGPDEASASIPVNQPAQAEQPAEKPAARATAERPTINIESAINNVHSICLEKIRHIHSSSVSEADYVAKLTEEGVTRIDVRGMSGSDLMQQLISLNGKNGQILAVVPDPALQGGLLVVQVTPRLKALASQMMQLAA